MTRVLSILLLLSAGYAGAETQVQVRTYTGQVRVQTRAEGVVIALDIEGDGIVDHIFIADVRIAAAFAGPATVNFSDGDVVYIQVVPLDGSPGLQYIAGKGSSGPTWPTQHGYRSMSVLGLAHYSGPAVAGPFAALDSWAIPHPDVEDDRPTRPGKLSSIPWHLPSLGESHGPYVGQTRIVPQDGGALIAVDDSNHDGIVDVVIVLKTPESIEPWAGRALVEITSAGIRVAALDDKFRVIMAFVPTEIHNYTGRMVAVPLADLDALNLPQP